MFPTKRPGTPARLRARRLRDTSPAEEPALSGVGWARALAREKNAICRSASGSPFTPGFGVNGQGCARAIGWARSQNLLVPAPEGNMVGGRPVLNHRISGFDSLRQSAREKHQRVLRWLRVSRNTKSISTIGVAARTQG